jgi:hypothetical protein
VAHKGTPRSSTTTDTVLPSQSNVSTTVTPAVSIFDFKSSIKSDTGSPSQDFSLTDEIDLDGKFSIPPANPGTMLPTTGHLRDSDIPIDPGLPHAGTGTLANNTESLQSDETDMSGMEGTDGPHGLAEDEYELDKILGKWCRRGKELVFVKWLDGSTTWKPPNGMGNDQLVKQFEREYQGFREGVQVLTCRIRSGP